MTRLIDIQNTTNVSESREGTSVVAQITRGGGTVLALLPSDALLTTHAGAVAKAGAKLSEAAQPAAIGADTTEPPGEAADLATTAQWLASLPSVARAIQFARAVNSNVEIFQVLHEGALEHRLFVSDARVDEYRHKLLDAHATRLGECAAEICRQHADLTGRLHTRVVWSASRTEAVLDRVDVLKPSMVMKAAKDSSYVVGLTTNIDWDLARFSPVPVWFVKGTPGPVRRVVVGIGAQTSEDEVVSPRDYDVAQVALQVVEHFSSDKTRDQSEITVVHSFEVPTSLSTYAGYGPVYGAAHVGAVAQQIAVQDQEKKRGEIAAAHGSEVAAFASYFGVPTEDVVVRSGHAAQVLPLAAEEFAADLLVIGAAELPRSSSRWKRLVRDNTAEPVLADAPCDVLVVRFATDLEGEPAQDAAVSPESGVAVVDMEKALVDPAVVFATPEDVVKADDLSVVMRRRLLQIWEYDTRQLLEQDQEVGATSSRSRGDTSDAPERLRRIHDALRNLAPANARAPEHKPHSLMTNSP